MPEICVSSWIEYFRSPWNTATYSGVRHCTPFGKAAGHPPFNLWTSNHKEGLLVQGRPVQEMDMHDIVLLKNGGTVHEFVVSLAHYLRSVLGTYKTGLQQEQLWRNLPFSTVSIRKQASSPGWSPSNGTIPTPQWHSLRWYHIEKNTQFKIRGGTSTRCPDSDGRGSQIFKKFQKPRQNCRRQNNATEQDPHWGPTR